MSEFFRAETWSALPFLLSAGAAVLTLRLGDRYVTQFEQAMGEARTQKSIFDGKFMPTGRRYLSFHAVRAGWSVRWSIGSVWFAWCAPVGLVISLAVLIMFDLALTLT